MDIPSRKGIDERNRAHLERLVRSSSGPFSIRDAAETLSLDPRRAGRLLRYFAARGWLSRVRRGLYTTVPLGASAPALWREDPWVVAARVFEPSYIGGWSAAEHWSLTEQLFRVVVVVTDQPVRSSKVDIQGQPYHLKHASANKHFGTKTVWRGQVRVKVSDPPRTLIDMLDDPAIGGGIKHVAEILAAYWASEYRDDDRLVDYARRIGNRSVFKRLGFLIEKLGVDAKPVIYHCRRNLSAGLSALDPTVKRRGRILKRWNLRVNVALEEASTDR